LYELTNTVTVTSEVLAAVMLSYELLRFYGMLRCTYGITSQKMRVFAANVDNGGNEEYSHPEVGKHSYLIMPQFVKGHQKSWF
jgi:predicted SAM-dependent methyltransferase